MKSFLFDYFNFIRNLCLLIVLLSIAAVVFTVNDHAAKARFFAMIADYELDRLPCDESKYPSDNDIKNFDDERPDEPVLHSKPRS